MIQTGLFGKYGGIFAPETLMPALEELESAFLEAIDDAAFEAELRRLLRDFAGRPTPLYFASNLSERLGAEVYFKREDLLHGGAHKTNNAVGQALLAKRLGKTRIIAETGAGQHGVATAMAGALFGLETVIYMGEVDIERQQTNVERMKLLGAEVVPVTTGGRTLKDAINEALRDWVTNVRTTHYLIGTAAGPHPFPTMVKYFQKVIGEETRAEFLQRKEKLPDYVVACVGGGSNAIGMFSAFLSDNEVKLIGVEPAGRGLDTEEHGAVLSKGSTGCLHGMISKVMQDTNGQIQETHSIAAGLDYPSVGPEHAFLKDIGRVRYDSATDAEAVSAFQLMAQTEGIIPALESSHAIAAAVKLAKGEARGKTIVVSLSGRGDKDIRQVMNYAE